MRNLLYCYKHFLRNLFYLICHLKHIKRGKKRLKLVRNSIGNIVNLNSFIKNIFVYERDKHGDMRPWMINFAIKNFHDDCDGIAAFSKWIGKKKHWKPEYWSLFGDNWGHAICIAYCIGVKFIADTKEVRKFISWEVNFPKAKRRIKRWY